MVDLYELASGRRVLAPVRMVQKRELAISLLYLVEAIAEW